MVPLVIAGALGFDSQMTTTLISASILAAGVATIIQARGIGPVGSRVACIMGTDFTFVSPAISVGSTLGMAGIVGATILGSLFEVVLSFFIKPLMKLFPPLVTGTVVCLIGLTLLPVSIDWAAGGSGASDYGSLLNISIAMIVLCVTLLLNRYGKGIISSAAILIGMAMGYVICIPLGLVDFTAVTEASWFAIPNILEYGITFDAKAVLAFIPAYFVTTIETVGCLKAIGETSSVEMTDKKMSSGILADAVGSICGGLVGSFSNTSFSQNVGLVAVTKVVNKFVIMTGAVFLILAGFFPKLSAILSVMPQSVLGGAAVIMFAMIFVSGLQSLFREKLDGRNALIVALAIGIGVGIGNVPEALAQLPTWISNIFAQNGIIMTFVIATILNLILPKNKEKVEAVSA